MAQKRGGCDVRLDIDAVDVPVDDAAGELLALDRALDRLAALEPRLSRVVELRFFAGLSVEAIAELRGQSSRTVAREWLKAKSFLRRLIDEGEAQPS
jgi:DNA-directed RNA polymerase specialized sigma24 family protein